MRMILFLGVVIILFAGAAGGSWYLQSQQNKDADTPKSADDKAGKNNTAPLAKQGGAVKSPSDDSAAQRPLIRPAAPASETERLTQLAATLQQQQEMIKTREHQISVREKQMDIVHEEVKKEQKKLEVMRKEVQAELALVMQKLDQLEKRSAQGDQDRKAFDAQKLEHQRTMIEVDNQEWSNLKKQVMTMEKMDPEAAGLVVVQMVDQGKLETAVKILSQMKDRQAAAIFAEIAKQDAKLPGQLFERMLTLKTPTVAAPK